MTTPGRAISSTSTPLSSPVAHRHFTAYDRAGFGSDDQRQLRDVFAALGERGVRAMLSNSDTPFVRELHDGFRIEQVWVAGGQFQGRRAGRGRGARPE